MAEDIKRKTVKVVVLGDIGRSPRMQYHCLSLANAGLNVNLIGYVDSSPSPELLENKHITITQLHPMVLERGPKIFVYAFKAMWQSISLLLTLLITGSCDYLLCQNPPAIPTLPICRFYCLVTRTKFIIDWHNYAHTIMAFSLPPNHLLLRIAKKIEMYFGQSSDHNFCVTNAMKCDLLENWYIQAKVVYDRPPKIFQPLTLQQKHDWFMKIGEQYPEFSNTGRAQLNMPVGDHVTERTAFTQVSVGNVELRADRPGLLFSSTSWTPDEDFSVLMGALEAYENAFKERKDLPRLVCVITGKGPMKEHYVKQVALRRWRYVKIVTPWLEAADYPKMVGSADLGVCLHTSSSGLDLPMKVIDMFGAGLPVCAFDFKCLGELVVNGVNGFTFKSSSELSKLILKWFEGYPNNVEQNSIANNMKSALTNFRLMRWEENWNLRAKEYFS